MAHIRRSKSQAETKPTNVGSVNMGRLCERIGGDVDAVARNNGVYDNEHYRNAIEHAHVGARLAYDYGETVADVLGGT